MFASDLALESRGAGIQTQVPKFESSTATINMNIFFFINVYAHI